MTMLSPVAHADTAFGADLHAKLAEAGGNIVLSPASVAAALKMALAGARGQTATELASVLRVEGPDDAAGALAELAGVRSGGDLILYAPNTMWLDSTLSVRDEYRRRLVGGVSVRRCNFLGAPEAARKTINDSVETDTAGKITGLLPPGLIDPMTRLVLVNAIYLNALWQHPFPVDDTKDKPFYPERISATAIPSMRLEARLAYHRGDGCQSVLLPYRGGTLAMAVLLPDGPLSEFTGSADIAGALSGLLAEETACLVNLSLPRFRVEAGFRLEDTLRSLGVRRAFTDAAEFDGISAEPLKISAVVHKAWIEVGEKGTEAAAATATAFAPAGIVRQPEPDVRLVVDRPFLFAIVDTATGLPLFLGQFTRPS
ncbi:MAG: serpin family protein [Nocardiopsaceae bacterium]|nr:serpin family protein [Nocardiopsaceae bacterium]